MKDRNVQFPQRYRIQKVEGTDDVFDLIPAPGEVSDDGTFLNKATLLKDVTASLFGLGADAVPDDVLASLGKYNQHWWWRKATTTQTRYDEVRTLYGSHLSLGQTSLNSAITVTYGAGIEIASDCTVSLNSPQTLSIDRYGKGDLLAGKYAQVGSAIYYIPSGAYLNVIGNSDNWTLRAYYLPNVVYTVTAFSYEFPIGEVDYVRSSDRNAYPDSGESDGYEWKYLGVPFDNAVTAAKVAVVSYVGTGVNGVNNPNTITLDFATKYLIMGVNVYDGRLYHDGDSFYVPVFVALDAVPSDKYIVYGSNGNAGVKKSTDGKTFTWYADSAQDQLNMSSAKYYVLAIG